MRQRPRGRPTNPFEPFPRAAVASTLAERFEERVRRHPRRLAVLDGDLAFTYAELDGQAAAIGGAVAPGPAGAVGLCFPQGWQSVAATLGVLKAGRAYVPLDHRLPPERLRELTSAFDLSAVVADAALAPAFDGAGTRVLDVDTLGSGAVDRRRASLPDDPAYVFVTSGSTGPPKGVIDTNRNVLHNVLRYTNSLHICASDRLSLIQDPSFSATVSTTFGALLNGATLLPFDLDREGAHALPRWLAETGATMFHGVPALFRHLLASDVPLDRIRIVRLEGDRALPSDIEGFQRRFAPGCILVNGLGATECGLVRQFFVDHATPVPRAPVPIGDPVEDMEILLLDAAGAPVVDGAPGEIVVRSEYLARGYHGRPDLTAAAFSEVPGRRVRDYRTGDLGRTAADGSLLYLGRVHDLSRIAGSDVDLAAIEAALADLPGVEHGAARVHEHDGSVRLVGYVVPNGPLPTPADVRMLLAARLPPTSVPAAVVPIDRLPLTANGKLDRSALPDPPRTRPGDAFPATPPGTMLEHELVSVWEDVLGISPVGVQDRFVDLGGTSLQAFEILGRIERLIERPVRPGVLVEGPTIERLAACLHRDTPEIDGVLVTPAREHPEGPLFFFHGDYLSGGVYCLRLAKALGPEHPLHVVPPAVLGAAGAPLGYEQMAERHLQALRRVRPRGPYRLAGNCNGGLVALEVARRLVADGERVSLLVVITSSLMNRRWSLRHGPIGVAGAVLRRGPVERFDAFRGRVLRWDARAPSGRVRAALRAARRAPADRSEPVVPAVADDLRDGARTVLRVADRDYRPRPFDGDVVVLWPREDPEFAQAARWWRGMARRVDFRPLPGDHVTCLTRHVETLAQVLGECLDERGPEGSP